MTHDNDKTSKTTINENEETLDNEDDAQTHVKNIKIENKDEMQNNDTVTNDAAVDEQESDVGIAKLKQRIAELEQKVKELEEENSTLKDQYLRKQADFENFRKRMHREKEEATKYANANLLLDMVSIIDDFERAIKAGEGTQDIESFRKGIELIEKQLVGMLERKWGLRRFDSEGEPFDPEKHEAIATEEKDTDVSEVTEDYQKGYFLHDRVLRHAKVRVSLPSTSQTDKTGENSNTDEKDNTDKGEE
jgi:molecular chaperone GrpE